VWIHSRHFPPSAANFHLSVGARKRVFIQRRSYCLFCPFGGAPPFPVHPKLAAHVSADLWPLASLQIARQGCCDAKIRIGRAENSLKTKRPSRSRGVRCVLHHLVASHSNSRPRSISITVALWSPRLMTSLFLCVKCLVWALHMLTSKSGR
jgi:hypothetical protein